MKAIVRLDRRFAIVRLDRRFAIVRLDRRFATTVALCAALALAACHEIPQDAAKPYAGKEDVKPYAGDRFKGDKQKFEQALADRAANENEYLRTGDAKQ